MARSSEPEFSRMKNCLAFAVLHWPSPSNPVVLLPGSPYQIPRHLSLRQVPFSQMEPSDSVGPESSSLLQVSSASSPTYSDLLGLCGSGRFHLRLLFACALANASDAVEVVAISYALPRVLTQLQVSPTQAGALTAIGFAGLLVGGVLWGRLADSKGRRRVLQAACALNAVLGAAAAGVSRVEWLILCRFLSGVGIGGSIPVVFTYFSEFIEDRRKGPWIVYLSLSWMFGSVFAAGMAWTVLDRESLLIGARHVESWRIFLLVCALPAFLAAILLEGFPESPQWLFTAGRNLQALEALDDICSENKVPVPPEIRSRTIAPVDISPRLPDASVHTSSPLRTRFFKGSVGALKSVFGPPNTRIGVFGAALWFMLSFGYYGFTIWQPEYLKQKGLSADNSSLYMSTFLISLAQLPGTILSAYSIQLLGRKPTLTLSLLLSGISIFFVLMVSSTAERIASSCLFSGVSVAAWNTLNVVSAELFSTEIRASAYGTLSSIGRLGSILGNFFFGWFSGSSPSIPLSAVFISLLLSALFSQLLPVRPATATASGISSIVH